MQDSRAEYEKRMHRVLEHIDRQLDQPLDLAGIAAVAHFSPFHFHRLFAAWMGETLGDYLRRRRVEMAAMRLAAQPKLSILQAALGVGFGSPEAFTRAFRLRFGASPTAWRRSQAQGRGKNSNFDQMDRKPGQVVPGFARNNGDSYQPNQEFSMKVKLIEREAATVAYLRYTGPYGAALSTFWLQTVAPWMATHNLMGYARYGISHDDPSITAPEQCRYDACVEVPANFQASGNAFKTTIPAGKYAVLGFKGTAAEVGAAWSALLRDWLPASGLQLDSRPCFEHYPVSAGYDPKTGVFDCEICIPVAPL